MAEDVVENVGLLKIIQFFRLADEMTGRKPPVGEVIEEHFVRDQTRHGDDLPARALHQHLAEAPKIGDLVRIHGQIAHALDELVAGAARQQLALTFEQGLPDPVLLGGIVFPPLIDGPVHAVGLSSFTGCGAVLFGLHVFSSLD